MKFFVSLVKFSQSSAQFSVKVLAKALALIVASYQWLISPFLGPRCRFYPSCSSYAESCFRELPLTQALFLVIKRVIKCSPLSSGGYDPPPVTRTPHE